jgi:hypothetical protein
MLRRPANGPKRFNKGENKMPRVVVDWGTDGRREYKFVFKADAKKGAKVDVYVGDEGSLDTTKTFWGTGKARRDSRDRPNAVIARREALRNAIGEFPKEVRKQIWNKIPLRKPKS